MMIKRDKRNIGKEVIVRGCGSFNNRKGKVMAFRGDHSKGNPFVMVFIYSLSDNTKGSNYPFPGSCLEKLRD